MSRIGQAPITLGSGVEASISGQDIVVKGPKGSLERRLPDAVTIEVVDGELRLTRKDDERESRALHGLSRALVANMVTGVTDGFSKELQLVGVGYRAAMKGSQIELQVGFSHNVLLDIPSDVSVEIPEQTRIIITGISNESVGQFAANVRRVRPPEPYKGKGIRYIDEVVRRKAGKAGVTA
ncbi:MAG: 50S ribosomal protein L6 [Acidimicrobiia bacterium]|nr:50S ribosomal protein L6 [Acidimicrobiia bacterium]NNK92256.1 50S ribosomal protein L6 [Acidimicrobiia bacterium]